MKTRMISSVMASALAVADWVVTSTQANSESQNCSQGRPTSPGVRPTVGRTLFSLSFLCLIMRLIRSLIFRGHS